MMLVGGDSSVSGHVTHGSMVETLDSNEISADNPLFSKCSQVLEVAKSVDLDEDLDSKILRQVEFYFSDANILKDQFILKSVKSNKEGWMKLSTVAGFRRLQSLTKDENVVRRALKKSDLVEVSEDGSLIRRKLPLPEWDKTVYARSVLISRFADNDVVTVFSISEFFESVNLPVKLVRVIDAGKTIPPDLVKSATFFGYIGVEKSAIVEFDCRESASVALAVIRNSWPHCFCTVLQRRTNVTIDKSKHREKLTKKPPAPKANMSARPQISLTSCMNKEVKVELVREPVAPPSEDSVGFEPNWREILRLQRVSILEDNENTPATPHLSTSASSDEFFTPQAPSPKPPKDATFVPATPVFSLTQPQFFDEAIVFMTPNAE